MEGKEMRNLRKPAFVTVVVLLLCVLAASVQAQSSASGTGKSVFAGDASQEFYMIVPLAGHEYWKGPLKGFQDAAKKLGVKAIFTGSKEYEANAEVTTFDQIVALKPAGIAVAPIIAPAFEAPIKRAIQAGIPVVTFDTDSPRSARLAYCSTANLTAGEIACRTLMKTIDGTGDIALLYSTGQQNIEERVIGFKNVLAKEYPNAKIVATGDAKGDEVIGAKAVAAILQSHPDIKAIYCGDSVSGVAAAVAVKEAGLTGKIRLLCFDTNKKTLDLVKDGSIDYTMAQGVYNMGFWAMMFLYVVKNDVVNPVDDWKSHNIDPLPAFVDTGITAVDKSNVDLFYSK
jgi:ribose transport system substrate-binding protein